MSKFDNFKYTRWVQGFNYTLQILLSLTLWAALNFIAAKQYSRQDLTYSQKFSLSQETLKRIEQIEEPVQIFVSSPNELAQEKDNEILTYILNLLREYEYAGRQNGKKKIEFEFINIYQHSEKAQMLVDQFEIDPTLEYAIVVVCGDNYREVLKDDIYKVDESGEILFKGEEVFTSTILNVTNPDKQKVYWLVGHGEMSVLDVSSKRGISLAALSLRQRNLDLAPLDLGKLPRVPEDADLVIIPAPQTPLLPFEVEKLRLYLSKNNGRILAFLPPGQKHGLDDLLYEWGILVDDMLLFDLSDLARAAKGEILIDNFEEHPITDFLRNLNLRALFSYSRPVRPDPGAPFDTRLTTASLLSTSEKSWAERHYTQITEAGPQYNKATDLPGPVSIGMVSERSVDSNLGLNIPGGRLIVYGNSSFISNGGFRTAGNKKLFQNSVSWILDEQDQLSIPPQKLTQFQLPLSKNDLASVSKFFLILPAGIIGLGIITSIIRRR